MSPACDFEALDALAAGELGAAEAEAVRLHAAGCHRCGHELAWLRSERELFEQRARREQAGAIAVPPERPTVRAAPARGRRGLWVGAWAVAACLLMVVGGRQLEFSPPASGPGSREEIRVEARESVFPASVDPRAVIASLEQQVGACLVATPMAGFNCGATPEVPASFGLAGD